jgi:hypothetical protein
MTFKNVEELRDGRDIRKHVSDPAMDAIIQYIRKTELDHPKLSRVNVC